MMFSTLSFGGSFRNGNQLYEQLKYENSKDTSEQIKYLLGANYVLGVVDARFNKCEFRNVQSGQLFETVLLYLKSHPEMRQYTASSLVESSIKEKFKCD